MSYTMMLRPCTHVWAFGATGVTERTFWVCLCCGATTHQDPVARTYHLNGSPTSNTMSSTPHPR